MANYFKKSHITENFTYEEFFTSSTADSKHITNLPSTLSNYICVASNLPKLALILQLVRSIFGNSVRVTSGFRNPQLNKAVGGASLSEHQFGAAADIVAPNMRALYSALVTIQNATKHEGQFLFKIIPEAKGKQVLPEVATWYHVQLNRKVTDEMSIEYLYSLCLASHH